MQTLLLVDTDPFLAGIYAREFAQGGFTVLVAESAEQARILLEKQSVDVIVIDPDTVEGAWELMDMSAVKKCKRVVLTQLGEKQMIQKARNKGADTYLLKGHFVPSEICQKVLQLL
jgi:DNA-binding response OmpR family regulator